MAETINWDEINEKLPYLKGDEEKEKRKDLWKAIDINDNGYVSLAEITKGIRDVIGLPEMLKATPAINRAFHHAKDISKNESKHGANYLEFPEFRIFLQTLRQNFEYFQAFERIDSDDDRRISLEEFTAPAIKKTIEKWVGPIEDMEAEFKKIDKNDGGQILFSEFVDWSISKNLELEGDDD